MKKLIIEIIHQLMIKEYILNYFYLMIFFQINQ